MSNLQHSYSSGQVCRGWALPMTWSSSSQIVWLLHANRDRRKAISFGSARSPGFAPAMYSLHCTMPMCTTEYHTLHLNRDHATTDHVQAIQRDSTNIQQQNYTWSGLPSAQMSAYARQSACPNGALGLPHILEGQTVQVTPCMHILHTASHGYHALHWCGTLALSQVGTDAENTAGMTVGPVVLPEHSCSQPDRGWRDSGSTSLQGLALLLVSSCPCSLL